MAAIRYPYMGTDFSFVPRYRLDDDQEWLMGIDPLRRYWLQVNSQPDCLLVVPGLTVGSRTELKATLERLHSLMPGEQMTLATGLFSTLEICCISPNCFGILAAVNSAPALHLFDAETLESLLMTAHPDWRCAPQHTDLGRRQLMGAWQQPSAVKAA